MAKGKTKRGGPASAGTARKSGQAGRPGGHGQARRGPARRGPRTGPGRAQAAERLWLYGAHPVLAALENPKRRCRRLLVTAEAERRLGEALDRALTQARGRPGAALAVERRDRPALSPPLPDSAVHQGLALEVEPLGQPTLEDLLESAAGTAPEAAAGAPAAGRQVIVALDQVTDPQNVGAILRSAAAFGALAVLAPRSHAAPESGALAKAASGALERLPYLLVGNLARALETLKEAGFWCFGLASEGAEPLFRAGAAERAVLVLGAEGSGLRRLTREHCDSLLRLPTRPAMGQLNVSNAAAVALYELLGRPED